MGGIIHDRENHFDKATLEKCIKAISANIVMFCVRFSPYTLWNSNNSTSSVFNQFFNIELINPDYKSFYISKIIIPENQRNDLICYNSKEQIESRNVVDLVI